MGQKANKDFSWVFIKCYIINKVYSTRISFQDINKIAKAIVKIKDFDASLEKGEHDLVQEIRKIDGVNDNFVFATKYCALHKNKEYPIYDNLSIEVLFNYQIKDNKNLNIAENLTKFKNYFRSDGGYKKYVEFYNHFIERFGLQEFNYREIDKYLWTVGTLSKKQ